MMSRVWKALGPLPVVLIGALMLIPRIMIIVMWLFGANLIMPGWLVVIGWLWFPVTALVCIVIEPQGLSSAMYLLLSTTVLVDLLLDGTSVSYTSRREGESRRDSESE